MFVALLALFVALGGSAYAVSKVGTKDLKKDSVTSAKLKDKTIKQKDVSPKAREALRGGQGPQGPPGPPGASLRNAAQVSVAGIHYVADATLAQIDGLAPGQYAVVAKLSVRNEGANTGEAVTCTLDVPGTTADDQQHARLGSFPSGESQMGFPLTTVFTADAAASVGVSCTNPGGDNNAYDIHIVAIPVG